MTSFVSINQRYRPVVSANTSCSDAGQITNARSINTPRQDDGRTGLRQTRTSLPDRRADRARWWPLQNAPARPYQHLATILRRCPADAKSRAFAVAACPKLAEALAVAAPKLPLPPAAPASAVAVADADPLPSSAAPAAALAPPPAPSVVPPPPAPPFAVTDTARDADEESVTDRVEEPAPPGPPAPSELLSFPLVSATAATEWVERVTSPSRRLSEIPAPLLQPRSMAALHTNAERDLRHVMVPSVWRRLDNRDQRPLS